MLVLLSINLLLFVLIGHTYNTPHHCHPGYYIVQEDVGIDGVVYAGTGVKNVGNVRQKSLQDHPLCCKAEHNIVTDQYYIYGYETCQPGYNYKEQQDGFTFCSNCEHRVEEDCKEKVASNPLLICNK